MSVTRRYEYIALPIDFGDLSALNRYSGDGWRVVTITVDDMANWVLLERPLPECVLCGKSTINGTEFVDLDYHAHVNEADKALWNSLKTGASREERRASHERADLHDR